MNNFERGNLDPKITMEIGNPILREFDKIILDLKKQLKESLEDKDFDIQNFSIFILALRTVIPLVIRQYYEKKYGWNFYETDRCIGKVDIENFTLSFLISSQNTSFAIRLTDNKGGCIQSKYATSFFRGDKEIKKILKIIQDNGTKVAD